MPSTCKPRKKHLSINLMLRKTEVKLSLWFHRWRWEKRSPGHLFAPVHPRQHPLRVNFLSLYTKSADIIFYVTFTPVMTMWKAQPRLRRALQNDLRQCRVIHTPFGEIGLEKLHCTPLYHVEGLLDRPAELWSGNRCSGELTFFFFFYRNYLIL